jgi:hypothetical protein
MISVIVPICWGFKPFVNFLSNLVELPVVGEVILINNNRQLTPHHEVLEHSKVKHHIMEENIFVNPSWNMGASLAENDLLCILSDDVLVDLRAFFEADKFVTKEVGALGIEIHHEYFRALNSQYEYVTNIQNIMISGDIQITEHPVRSVPVAAGSLFFIHKENWIDIPESFKIYFGDTWTFDIQRLLGRKNYAMKNVFYHTPWNAASKIGVSSEYQQTEEYKQNESFDNYHKFISNFIEENKIQTL